MRDKVAAVIFLNKQNKLLFQLRDNKKSIPYPNTWAFLGGHIEKDETPEDALKREVKEEIGMNITKKDLKFIGFMSDLAENDLYIYMSRINKKLNELTLTEGQRLEYFSFEKVTKLRMPSVVKKFIIKNKDKIQEN